MNTPSPFTTTPLTTFVRERDGEFTFILRSPARHPSRVVQTPLQMQVFGSLRIISRAVEAGMPTQSALYGYGTVL
jgi:hypothetical protein